MEQTQKHKKTVISVLGVSFALLYFVVFLFPNLKGAQNFDMLGLFEIDEYAQYPYLEQMLTRGASLYQTIRNFAVYSHYFYGYPFYFFSALTALPLRLLQGSDWAANTSLVLVVLRQVISVAPIIAAAAILVQFKTKRKAGWRSVGLFVFLLLLPSVVKNNLWWHPDSLAFLFVALTFYFLDRDGLAFGNHFFFAALSTGLAIGTKHMGEFFILAIPVYILWGILQKKICWSKGLLLAVLFVIAMLAAVVISNPLLLLPQERSEIIAVQIRQFSETTRGSLVANAAFNVALLRQNLGRLWFIGLALVGMGLGFYHQETRLQTTLILCWLLPLSYVVFFASPQRAHYYLNLGLPLYLCLDNLFIHVSHRMESEPKQTRVVNLLRWGAVVLIVAQGLIFLQIDQAMVQGAMQREDNSKALQFYDRLETEVLTPVSAGSDDVVVYRDWKVYCPSQPGRRVVMDWGMATETFIAELSPDVMILETANIVLFTETSTELTGSGSPGELQQFYGAAADDRVKGYRLVIADDFAHVLVSDAVYDRVFKQ